MDCIVHGVAKNQTRLSDFHFNLYEHQPLRMSSNIFEGKHSCCEGRNEGRKIGRKERGKQGGGKRKER